MSASSLHRILDTVLGPILTADRGEVFLMVTEPSNLHLHLRGRYSGCPGNTLVIRRVIEPILRATAPDARLTVTTGDLIPEGAEPWAAPNAD